MSTTSIKNPMQITKEFGKDLAFKAKRDADREEAKKVNARVKAQSDKLLKDAQSESGAYVIDPTGRQFHITSTVRVEYFVEKLDNAEVIDVSLDSED